MQVPAAILQAAATADSLNEYIGLNHEEVCSMLASMLVQCKNKSVAETRRTLPHLGRVLHALQPQLCRSQELSAAVTALYVHLLLAPHQARQESGLDERTVAWAAGHLQESQSSGLAADEEALMGSLGFLQQELARSVVDERQEGIQRLCGAKVKTAGDSPGAAKRPRGIQVQQCAALNSVWPLFADERLGSALAESVTRVSGCGSLQRVVRPSVPLASLLSRDTLAALYRTDSTVMRNLVQEQLNSVSRAPATRNSDMRIHTDLWALAASTDADLAKCVDDTLCNTLLSVNSTFAHARLYYCYHTALASLTGHLSEDITVLRVPKLFLPNYHSASHH